MTTRLRFVVDAQLPPILAKRLNDAGYEAWHVAELGMLAADDRTIWQEARNRSAVIVTKDEDYLTLRMIDPGGPCVVWARIGNCSNRALQIWWDACLTSVVERLNAGEKLIELI